MSGQADRWCELGSGIIFCIDQGVAGELTQRGYVRFMDVLYLPARLHELTVEQIGVINRFRENHIADPQFTHWRQIRSFFVRAIRDLNAKAVLEIGCGKFPIADEITVDRFLGIDVDPTAISTLNSRGVPCTTLKDAECAEGSFDVVVSIYAMHFHLTAPIFDFISHCLSPDGVIVFNIIGDRVPPVLYPAEMLGNRGYLSRVVRGGKLARRETVFVMARPDGSRRMSQLKAAISTLLA